MIDFEHSPLGGSGASRWLKCSGSFLLQRLLMLRGEYEEPPTSMFADKGTAAHELGAQCLTDSTEPFEYIGQKFGAYTVSANDLDPDAVTVYVNHCRAIIEPGDNPVIEKTYHLRHIHPLFKGTVDFGLLRLPPAATPGLWLVDYKNGEGIGVQAYQNPQLLYYAALLVEAYSELKAMSDGFPVHLAIVQPNYWGAFEEPETWITDLGTVRRFYKGVLIPRMKQLTDDKREQLASDDFVSGDHCQFCPVMLDCPKLRKDFETYATADEFIEMLTDTELSDLYAMRDNARRYGNELEKVVFARKIAGKDIPSAKLVEKQVRRVWKTGAEAAAQARFKDFAYNPRELKSPSQFEKMSSDGKAFALEWGFKPDSDRLTVAPISDRRAEAKPQANADIFKSFASATPVEDLGW